MIGRGARGGRRGIISEGTRHTQVRAVCLQAWHLTRNGAVCNAFKHVISSREMLLPTSGRSKQLI